MLPTWTNVGPFAPPAAQEARRRASRPEMAAMAVTAIAGIIGLAALAINVTRPPVATPGAGATVREECVSICVHPTLHDLAKRLSESGELRSQEAYIRNAAQPGLKGAWYIITFRLIQADGNEAFISQIQRPFESIPAFSTEFSDVLATVAGNPPSDGQIGYSGAAVVVVPDRLLSLDPREAFDELQLLGCIPRNEKGP
jgi:hypothetical protein